MSVTRRTTLSRPGLTRPAFRQAAPAAAAINGRTDPEAVGQILDTLAACQRESQPREAGIGQVTRARRLASRMIFSAVLAGVRAEVSNHQPVSPSSRFMPASRVS